MVDVIKKVLNGLIIKRIIKNIEIAEHVHIFFVESENIIKLKGASKSIYFILYYFFITII
jgi:hypothetical protein